MPYRRGALAFWILTSWPPSAGKAVRTALLAAELGSHLAAYRPRPIVVAWLELIISRQHSVYPAAVELGHVQAWFAA